MCAPASQLAEPWASGLQDCVESGHCGSTGAGHVELGHEDETSNSCLLFAESRAVADVLQEPRLECVPGLHDTTTDEISVGSWKFAAMVKSRPNAIACCSISRVAIRSGPLRRTAPDRAASEMGSDPSSWSGSHDNRYGRRLSSMPASDTTLSASPKNPQLHLGMGSSGSRSPAIGMCTWPSSPAAPVAPLTTRPRCPIHRQSHPTMAETNERERPCRPKCRR